MNEEISGPDSVVIVVDFLENSNVTLQNFHLDLLKKLNGFKVVPVKVFYVLSTFTMGDLAKEGIDAFPGDVIKNLKVELLPASLNAFSFGTVELALVDGIETALVVENENYVRVEVQDVNVLEEVGII